MAAWFRCGVLRRHLRRHREELRVAVTVLQNNGLGEEFDELCLRVTGNDPHWLGYGSLDEADDPSTDPMLAVQRATAEEHESLARLIVALEDRRRDQERLAVLQLELERARMLAEDLMSRIG